MRIFVAGATGFTGRAMAELDLEREISHTSVELSLQVRTEARAREVFHDDARVVVTRPKDADLKGYDALIQLIGTVRKRFDDTTSYETVDFGTTRDLLMCARRDELPHFVLVSSMGAGFGIGSYLAWKKRTEQLVRESGVPSSIVRPGIIAGDEGFEERSRMSSLGAFLHGMGQSPLGASARDARPMPVRLLARLPRRGRVRGSHKRSRARPGPMETPARPR